MVRVDGAHLVPGDAETAPVAGRSRVAERLTKRRGTAGLGSRSGRKRRSSPDREEPRERRPRTLAEIEAGLRTASDRERTIELLADLEGLADPRVAPLVLRALDDPDPEVRGAAGDAVFSLVSRRFPSYETAVAWWEADEHRFSAELSELDDG